MASHTRADSPEMIKNEGIWRLQLSMMSFYRNYPKRAPACVSPAQEYGHVRLGYEDLFRRKQEQWAHHHHHHGASRPSQSSPIFTIDFGSEVGGRQWRPDGRPRRVTGDARRLLYIIILEITKKKKNVGLNSHSRKLLLGAIYCTWVIVA